MCFNEGVVWYSNEAAAAAVLPRLDGATIMRHDLISSATPSVASGSSAEPRSKSQSMALRVGYFRPRGAVALPTDATNAARMAHDAQQVIL